MEFVRKLKFIKSPFDSLIGVLRAPIHIIDLVRFKSGLRFLVQLKTLIQGSSNCESVIPHSRLDERSLQTTQVMDTLVQFDISHHSNGKRQIGDPDLLNPIPNVSGGHILQNTLDSCCEIFHLEIVAKILLQLFYSRPVESTTNIPNLSGLILNILSQKVYIVCLSIARQTSDFSFMFMRVKSAKVGHIGIIIPYGIIAVDFVEQTKLPVPHMVDMAGATIPSAIEADCGRLLHAGRKVR